MLPLATAGTIVIFLNPENRSKTTPLAQDRMAESNNANELATPDIKPRSIEVFLSDERYREAPLQFKPPSWDNLAASANRLLKFEFPPIRDAKVYERLIKTNVLSTGISKRTLETLPLPFLETIYRELWQPFQPSRTSEWLTLFLLAEERCEFNAGQLVEQDIKQIGLRDTGALHSYYYKEHLSREDMSAFLTGHGYRTDFLEAIKNNGHSMQGNDEESALNLAYLACRRFTHPLPWAELLDQLTPAEFGKYPRLARLKAIQELLQHQQWTTSTITPDILQTSVDQLKALMTSKAFLAIAAQYASPRPVQELVIVEGETEKMLLPLFAESMALDFNALGIDILPAGGKNHVSALYREFSRHLNAPICIVLDNDAAEIANELAATLRPQDYVFQIAEGEFEDLYDLDLILKTINQHYQPYPEVTRQGFAVIAKNGNARGRVQALRAIWQAYNLGSFDKIEFAGKYAEYLKPATPNTKTKKGVQPPAAIRKLLETILSVRSGKG